MAPTRDSIWPDRADEPPADSGFEDSRGPLDPEGGAAPCWDPHEYD